MKTETKMLETAWRSHIGNKIDVNGGKTFTLKDVRILFDTVVDDQIFLISEKNEIFIIDVCQPVLRELKVQNLTDEEKNDILKFFLPEGSTAILSFYGLDRLSIQFLTKTTATIVNQMDFNLLNYLAQRGFNVGQRFH